MKLYKRTCDACSEIHESTEDRPGSFKSVKIDVNDKQFYFTLDLCGNCYNKTHSINISKCCIIKEKVENEA